MFSTAKNSKCFSLVIPASEKYVPLVRSYVIEILAAYNYQKDFLYQMEIMIDELCCTISQEVKQTAAAWLNIKFEIGENGFSFNVLEHINQNSESFAKKESTVLEEHGIVSPEFALIERYSDSARMELKNGKILNVKMARAEKRD
jgi:anti-sigma regulatory factor (Ser/Thr protein kinase)